jgi:dihydrodipicolinate synthase/N-acetylneuraminate lyase
VTPFVAAPRPGGIVCPVVTPLTPDGALDEDVLRTLIEALVPDLDGLFVLGSTGELAWLTDGVALRVAQIAVDQLAGRIPAYVGIGDTSLARTLDRVARLGELEPAYLVVTTPFYYPVTSEARLVEHFERIAERAPAPIVVYNIPQNTHCPVTPSVVRALAGHPRIAGIKDSSGDWATFDAFLALRSDDFRVMQGREALAAISLWSGADGLISGMGNLAPRLLQALAASIRDGRPRSETLALQATLGRLSGVVEHGHWLAGVKCALQAVGWDVGEPSAGIEPYDAGGRQLVEGIVRSPELAAWITPAPADRRRGIGGPA